MGKRVVLWSRFEEIASSISGLGALVAGWRGGSWVQRGGTVLGLVVTTDSEVVDTFGAVLRTVHGLGGNDQVRVR